MIAEHSFAINKYNIVSPFSLSKLGSAVWASGGVRVVEFGQAAAAVNNPATLFSSTFTISAEFSKRFDAHYIGGLTLDGQYLAPAFVSAILPIENMNLSIGYYQPYNEQMDFGQIPITTEQYPDGTGEFITGTNQRTIQAVFVSGSYRLNNNISVGTTIEYDIANQRDELFNTKLTGSGHSFGIILGMHANYSELFSAGVSMRYVPEFSISYSINPQLNRDPSGSGNNAVIGEIAFPDYVIQQPFIAEAGLLYNFSSIITFVGSLEFQQGMGSSEGFSDVVQGHFGCMLNVSSSAKIRLGYFTQNHPTQIHDALDQQFITGGIETSVTESIVLIAGIQSSSMFTNPKYQEYFGPADKDFHQAQLMAGITFRY